MLSVLALALAAPAVDYDRGERGVQGDARHFEPAEGCTHEEPCVVTRDGALTIDADGWQVELLLFRKQELTPIALFQSYSEVDDSLLKRAFPEGTNPPVLNIDGNLDQLRAPFEDTLFVFGLHNQYQLRQGDLLYLRFREPGTGQQISRYFRYYETALQVRPDATTLLPIASVLQPADLSFALSARFSWYLDPDRNRSGARALAASVDPTIYLGAIRLGYTDDAGRVRHEAGVFAGAGLTVAQAFNAGVGLPILEDEIAPFPFLGVHIGGLVELVQRVGSDPGRRWERFFEREKEATQP